MNSDHPVHVVDPGKSADEPIDVARIPIGAAGVSRPVVAELPGGEPQMSAYRADLPAGTGPAPGHLEIEGDPLDVDRKALHDRYHRLIPCASTDPGHHRMQVSDTGPCGQMYQ